MTLTQKTKDYSLFKFRTDNRQAIDMTHVKRLKALISARNLLDLRPILVNEDMEVIDGQHRVLAAKELGVEIYYTIEKNLRPADVILMNINKQWKINDFMNFYIKNGYQEYIKLDLFLKEQNLKLHVGLHITMGRKKERFFEFKSGNYKFNEMISDKIELCWETINYINELNGFANSLYTKTARFWKALVILLDHEDFDLAQWKKNIARFANRFTVKATFEAYLELFTEVYNFRAFHKIAV